MRRSYAPAAKVPPTLQRLSGGTRLARHGHAHTYAAVVLRGGYLEAGSPGRLEAEAGTVLVHPAYAAHLNVVLNAGATVLNLPLPGDLTILPHAFRIEDPDRVAAAAEASVEEALRLLQPNDVVDPLDDWPDMLARALAQPSTFSLEQWADEHGLHPASVSRGFRRAFGASPRRFRAEMRTLGAVARLIGDRDPIVQIANSEGFSDQAHMTRAVRSLTGRPPLQLRQAKRVQDGVCRLR